MRIKLKDMKEEIVMASLAFAFFAFWSVIFYQVTR